MNKILAAFFIFSLLFISCKKEEPIIPVKTSNITGTWKLSHSHLIIDKDTLTQIDEDENRITFRASELYSWSGYEDVIVDGQEVRKMVTKKGTYKFLEGLSLFELKEFDGTTFTFSCVESTGSSFVIKLQEEGMAVQFHFLKES
ncbi:hypothetical protein [Sphingobacterium sp. BN32]|uniref:hypothetical protein n=1 Tax=Sphingobacterium sp. BN32 TaxID=3058432 RepID=UPI00265CC279|nr:hypothetical protein [Sphingobacterium sp. BN32]WKK59640.1 hypothetical protein QYC40_05240 [Sphingobacterium sp. BN32]